MRTYSHCHNWSSKDDLFCNWCHKNRAGEVDLTYAASVPSPPKPTTFPSESKYNKNLRLLAQRDIIHSVVLDKVISSATISLLSGRMKNTFLWHYFGTNFKETLEELPDGNDRFKEEG